MSRTKWMTASDEPFRDELVAELDEIAGRAGEIYTRRLDAEDVRRCRWDGQSADGRKWSGKMDKPAFPWEGAADTRVRLADEIINDHVQLYTEAFFAAKLQARAIESGDLERANNVSTLLRWLRDGLLHEELLTEVELAAQWREGDDPGMCVVSCLWKRETALEMQTLTIEEALAAAAEVTGSEEAGEDLILSRALEAQALDLMEQAWPQIKRPRLRKALRELRKNGTTELPVSYVKANRPCIRALRIFEDIFFPPGTTDLQRARILFTREWLTEVELAERKLSEDWDGDWIEAVLEVGPGGCIARAGGNAGTEWAFRSFEEKQESLYEVWRAYYRAHDEMGIPAMQETIFHHGVRDAWAKHGPLGHPDGDYPFTVMRREVLSRELTDSRGIPQLVVTQQVEVKIQRDCRAAATQLATLPMMKILKRRGGVELVLGPAAQLRVERMDELEWQPPPPFPSASLEIEKATRQDMESYFARPGEGVAPARVQLYAQSKLRTWNAGWKAVFSQALGLMQRFMDPVEIERVTGQPAEEFTKEMIRGRYDLTVEVDARDMDLDFLVKKMEIVGKYVLPADQAGTFDVAGIAKEVLGAVDSRWAQRYVRDSGAVSMQEIEEEQTALVKMANGIEVPLRERGVNAKLRLQVIEQTLSTSPKLQEALTEPDGLFAKLLENHKKNLQHMIDQEQNKMIGRTGTAPVLEAAAGATDPDATANERNQKQSF